MGEGGQLKNKRPFPVLFIQRPDLIASKINISYDKMATFSIRFITLVLRVFVFFLLSLFTRYGSVQSPADVYTIMQTSFHPELYSERVTSPRRTVPSPVRTGLCFQATVVFGIEPLQV